MTETATIIFRLTKNEKEKLKRLASDAGMTLTQWIKHRSLVDKASASRQAKPVR